MNISTSIVLGEDLYGRLRGKQDEPFEAVVVAEDVIAYALSTEDDNPIRYDAQSAQAEGYANIVAPPAFLLALAAKSRQNADVLADFGFYAELRGDRHRFCRGRRRVRCRMLAESNQRKP